MATQITPNSVTKNLYVTVAFENHNGVYSILDSLGMMSGGVPLGVLETGNLSTPDVEVDHFVRTGNDIIGSRSTWIPTKTIINNEIFIKNRLISDEVYERALYQTINYNIIDWKFAYASDTSNIITIYSDTIILTVWHKTGNWVVSPDPVDGVYTIVNAFVYDSLKPVTFKNLIKKSYEYPVHINVNS